MSGVILLFLIMFIPATMTVSEVAVFDKNSVVDDLNNGSLRDDAGDPNAADSALQAVALAAPDFKGSPLPLNKSIQQVKLNQKSKVSNGSAGESEWFDKNQLQLPIIYSVEPYIPKWLPNAYVPRDVPDNLKSYNGIPLMTAYEYGDTQVYTYGDVYYHVVTLQITKNDQPVRAYDLSSFAAQYQHYIAWAVVEDDVLYIQHTGNGYAAGFDGNNGYISAISIPDNKLLWTSKPLTANARNFIVSENSIICGYGFTDEPDYLYVLDKFSGERVQTVKLKTGPDFIVQNGALLYVRTYNENYVFYTRPRKQYISGIPAK